MKCLWISAVVIAACSHATPLAPLPAQMTPDQRMGAYAMLRPDPGAGPSSRLVLANGAELDEPDALLAVLPPNGPAVRAARSYSRARTIANIAKWTFWLGVLGGLAAVPSLGGTVGLSMIGTGLVAVPVGMVYSSRARKERLKGLVLYER